MKNLFKNEPTREETPFQSIALAFSGGGFRAASFALGVLSYLNDLEQEDDTPLIRNVTFISSASGGTIANAMYARNNAVGNSFGEFYKKLFENLDGTVLLDHVFKMLNDDKVWVNRPDKKRNLINAFALAYDTCLFDGTLLGELYPAVRQSHLEEVCFNATEFYRGLLFRQNIKMKEDAKFKDDKNFRYGNFAVNLKTREAGRLRLSDLLAASSCFPAGFEPIVFPDDFTYNNVATGEDTDRLSAKELLDALYIQLRELDLEELERLYGPEVTKQVIQGLPEHPDPAVIKEAFKNVPVDSNFKFGMMDGGITDNQALESILDAQERRLAKNQTSFAPFDLMLINDVGSDYMDPYVPKEQKSRYTGIKGITVNTMLVLLSVFFAIGLGAVLAGFYMDFDDVEDSKIAVLVGTVVGVLCALGLGVLLFIRYYIKGNIGKLGGLDLDKNFSPEIVSNLFSHFGATPIGVILSMLNERFSSVLLLNNDVFLKRIRFLLYNSAYNSKRYTYRIKTNHVYDLSFTNDAARDEIPGVSASKHMKIVAQAAFEMGTTLWFDTKNQQGHSQAALIACGQFTTCYNLLKYIYRLRKSPTEGKPSYYDTLSQYYKEKVDFLEEKLMKDFKLFEEEPFWLYNRCGENFQVEKFEKCYADRFKFPTSFKGLR